MVATDVMSSNTIREPDSVKRVFFPRFTQTQTLTHTRHGCPTRTTAVFRAPFTFNGLVISTSSRCINKIGLLLWRVGGGGVGEELIGIE